MRKSGIFTVFTLAVLLATSPGCQTYKRLAGTDDSSSAGTTDFMILVQNQVAVDMQSDRDESIRRLVRWSTQCIRDGYTLPAGMQAPAKFATYSSHPNMSAFCSKSAEAAAEVLRLFGVHTIQVHAMKDGIGYHQFFIYQPGPELSPPPTWRVVDPYFGIIYGTDDDPSSFMRLELIGAPATELAVRFDSSRGFDPADAYLRDMWEADDFLFS